MNMRLAFAFAALLTIGVPCSPLRGYAQSANQVIYDNQLENGWGTWGWANSIVLDDTSPVPTGFSDSIAVTAGPWQAIWLHSASDFNDSAYVSLSFEISGGAAGGQQLQVQATLANSAQTPYYLQPLPGNNGWTTYTIPLTALGAQGASHFDGFWIQDTTGTSQPTFYLGNVMLVYGSLTPPSATVSVDATANTHPISPLIYGVAYGTTDELLDLNAPINRYGGNATSQYNWKLNAANRGSDWYFESIGDSPATPGGDGDAYVSQSKAGGSQAAITIPTIGWVANLGPNGAKLDSFSVAKYGAQQKTDPYWSDAGNGVLLSGANVVNDPNDANVPADVAFQQGWVDHLISNWGNSLSGGVKYYIMDNEPSIWQGTHRDVHPIGPTMAEVGGDIASYGAMIKAADPNALVIGPEEWGWDGYFYSGYDQQNGNATDQTAHGGMYYLPWVLQQLQTYQQTTGQRVLDYFTVHFYPQGGETNADDSTNTDLLRNRSTRQLWDPNYVSESWIASTGINNGIVELIPLMKSWVGAYYPGTKIGVTEYNWGDEDAMNGATTQADIEGIFGAQGLDLATRWGVPDPSGPAYQAMKIYRNYDGNQSTFGDVSVSDTVPNPDNLSSFASVRSSDGALTIVVDNKWLFSGNTAVTLNIANFVNAGEAHVYQLAAPGTSIAQLADIPIANGSIAFSAPPQSVTMFVVPAGLAIASVNPSSTPAGGLTAKIAVNGSGFDPNSIVEWNGANLTTQYVSPDQLVATVPAGDMKKPGTASITVNNRFSSGVSNAATFTIGAPDAVSSVSLSQSSVTGGSASELTITLSGPAPAGGQTVNLKSGSPSIAKVPATVTVPAGSTNTAVRIKTVPVAANATSLIKASANGTAQSQTLTVLAPVAASVTLSPSSVVGGATATGTVKLSGATAAASVVNLSSDSAYAGVAPSVTILAGASKGVFSVTTTAVKTKQTAAISAGSGGVTAQALLKIKP
jgi:hypothetical protein